MNVAVGLMDGLGLDGDRCIRVIPRQLLVTTLFLILLLTTYIRFIYAAFVTSDTRV